MDKYLYLRDDGPMELVVIVLMLIMFDLLAARFGYDSRILDPRDNRRWWPS